MPIFEGASKCFVFKAHFRANLQHFDPRSLKDEDVFLNSFTPFKLTDQVAESALEIEGSISRKPSLFQRSRWNGERLLAGRNLICRWNRLILNSQIGANGSSAKFFATESRSVVSATTPMIQSRIQGANTAMSGTRRMPRKNGHRILRFRREVFCEKFL